MFLKMKSRKLILGTLLVAMLLCVCFAVACFNKPQEKIELYFDYDAAIVTEEYDVKSIISDSNGYKVVLVECYYLDGEMNRVDIPIVDGTKFTPMVEREVFITLQIKGSKFIKEAIIPVEPPVPEETPVAEEPKEEVKQDETAAQLAE